MHKNNEATTSQTLVAWFFHMKQNYDDYYGCAFHIFFSVVFHWNKIRIKMAWTYFKGFQWIDYIQPFFSLSRRFVVRALIAQSIKSFNSSNNICQISKCHFVHIARQQASWLAATTQFQVKDLKIIQSFAIIVPDNGKFKSGWFLIL